MFLFSSVGSVLRCSDEPGEFPDAFLYVLLNCFPTFVDNMTEIFVVSTYIFSFFLLLLFANFERYKNCRILCWAL